MFLGVDIGGTTVKLALVTEEGTVTDRAEAPTGSAKIPVIDAIVQAIHTFIDGRSDRIRGIGVSSAGIIDSESGTILTEGSQIKGWKGICIRERFQKEFGLFTTVINDANAALLGENFVGRAVGCKNVVMITVGTGIGGSALVSGVPLMGQHGFAGELGHFFLVKDGLPCGCGRNGCYECYASMTALLRRAKEATEEEGLNGRIIFDRIAGGDPVLEKVTDGWLQDIAAGLVGLVHIFEPELIIVGGGVSAQEKLFIEPLRKKVLEGVLPVFGAELRLESALLKNDAGAIGAVKYCIQKLRE